MFNFYLVLAGCDTAGLTHKGENSKIHPYKKSTKNEGPPENMVFKGKNFWRFQTKKEQKLYSQPFEKPTEHTAPKNSN